MDQTQISKNSFFVYVIRSKVDGSYYIGQTRDVNTRLLQHNNSKSKYTNSHRPYELVYLEFFSSRKEAEVREKYIKKYGNTKNFLKSRVPSIPIYQDRG